MPGLVEACQRGLAQDVHVQRGVVLPRARGILSEDHVEAPVELAFYGPVPVTA